MFDLFSETNITTILLVQIMKVFIVSAEFCKLVIPI